MRNMVKKLEKQEKMKEEKRREIKSKVDEIVKKLEDF